MSRSLIFLCPCWLFLFPLEGPLEEMDDHDGEGRPDERGDQRDMRCWDLEVLIPGKGVPSIFCITLLMDLSWHGFWFLYCPIQKNDGHPKLTADFVPGAILP
jgi:hypothetical protein